MNVHAKITPTIYLRRFEWESNTIHFRFTVYDASANNTFFNMRWKYCGWCQPGVSLLSVSLLSGIVGEAIMLTDEIVGKILNRLKQHGIDDNTLVLFTSDNGSHEAEYLKNLYDHNPNGIDVVGRERTWFL